MQIRVECYSGHRGEEEPRAFWLGDRRMEVTELLDRWLSPNHRYFKVKTQDGDIYILRYDDIRDEWTLGAYTRAHPRESNGEESGTPQSSAPEDQSF